MSAVPSPGSPSSCAIRHEQPLASPPTGTVPASGVPGPAASGVPGGAASGVPGPAASTMGTPASGSGAVQANGNGVFVTVNESIISAGSELPAFVVQTCTEK